MSYDFKVTYTPSGSDESIDYCLKAVQTGAGGQCWRMWVSGGVLSNGEDEMVFDTMEEALGAVAAEIQLYADFELAHREEQPE